jgi:hypothetical protein
MSNDFIRKFYHPRFCQITELEAYLNARENPGMLFNLGSTFHSLTLVALEGGWDNTIYVPCMLGPDTPVDFLKQFTFVAYNYRLYESERSGLGASWPHGSSIVLRTGELAPGRYRLSLSDTGLPDDDFSAIALDVGSGGSAAGGWEHEEMSVMYPLENAYPAVMPPWYARLARKQGPVEVRKARKHVLEFSIAETSDRLRLRNQGEDLIFMGSVELVETISGTIVAGVDFDWGTADEINMKTALLLEDREVPLLWKDSAFDIRVRVTAGGSAPLALKLEENFNDVKVLSLCDEFYASGFQQRTALTF